MDSSYNNLLLGSEQLPAASAAHWLAVEVSGAPFLVPLSHSGEIFPWARPHPVPYTKDWFLGVVNLRGMLCGVADLSKWLGELPTEAGDQATSMGEKCFVGFHASLEINTVLVVDQLLGLKSLGTMKRQESPTHLAEFVDAQHRVWHEIDMFGLAKNADFVNIAATH